MKISNVLLRWHKSFNVNYNGYNDRKKSVTLRPWNDLHVEDGAKEDFLFIEIPVERDITTIVGANESGKSHLLDAVCKVLNGYGNDDRFLDKPNEEKKFAVTDLCHFASVRTKNAEAYPNIGLGFDDVQPGTADAILAQLASFTPQAIPPQSIAPAVKNELLDQGFTLVLAPREGQPIYAYIFIGSTKFELTEVQLNDIRLLLPKVEFIRSNLPIADEISLESLIAAYGGVQWLTSYEPNRILEVAKSLQGLPYPINGQPTAEWIQQVVELQNQVAQAQIASPSQGRLEAMLFDKIMGISLDALQKVAALRLSNRSFAEGQIALWNVVLRDELNLSRYWQQDPFFALQLNLKRGILYFEIKDKTGSTYTFAERSSGLRYFLSYYIQAKALEAEKSERPIVILMDEPDSFLSTQGQRNLLAVFESLVNASSSQGKSQLIYTTHSPWLINRNFPARLRLVRKGEAEEGTQYIHTPIVRRYEPVRSALGVDCAQTLFMGATNLVLEGPTEQLLLGELIRCFATPTTLYKFLDLNSIVTVSAESAANIPQVLAHSSWSDEVKPATVVLVDADAEGTLAIEKCCQDHFVTNAKGEKIKQKAGLPRQFALTVADLLGRTLGEANAPQKVVSIEDLVPVLLYNEAVRRYLQRWDKAHFDVKAAELEKALTSADFAKNGVADGVKECLSKLEFQGKMDKIGIAEEVIALVLESQREGFDNPTLMEAITQLQSRTMICCDKIQKVIDEAERQHRTATGTGSIRLSLRQFMAGRKGATISEITRTLRRLDGDVELLGEEGTNLREIVNQALQKLSALESLGQPRIEGVLWEEWARFVNGIQNNPLSPQAPLPNSTSSEVEFQMDQVEALKETPKPSKRASPSEPVTTLPPAS